MSAEPPDRPDAAPLKLSELVDLELRLLRDRDQPIEELDRRDASAAADVARGRLSGRAALRCWLGHVRDPGASVGDRVSELRDLTALVLFVLGMCGGATTVGSWLLQSSGEPINVIYFWPVIIGSQVALLPLWALAALPRRIFAWIPGLRAAQALLGACALGAISAVGRLVLRAIGPERSTLVEALGDLRRLEWLYARLRLWLVTGLTQAFAVGFNLGALASFVVVPYVDDPAFGWRSRLLDPPAVQRLADVLALPWRELAPRARLPYAVIAETRYSSIEPARTRERVGPEGVWAVWWPFLVASLVTYGLLPRLLLLGLAQLGLRSELRRAPRDHVCYARLLERLARLPIDSRALAPEPVDSVEAHDEPVRSLPLPRGPVRVLRWSGVPGDDTSLARALRAAGLRVIEPILSVGELDPGTDRDALRGLRQGESIEAACIVVPSWEPPVGDFTDLIRSLRSQLGDGRPLWLLLYPLETRATHQADDAAWQSRLRSLGDPWLHVAAWPSPA